MSTTNLGRATAWLDENVPDIDPRDIFSMASLLAMLLDEAEARAYEEAARVVDKYREELETHYQEDGQGWIVDRIEAATNAAELIRARGAGRT